MITIDQLLESMDLNFEPRFITKDKNGTITIFKTKPKKNCDVWVYGSNEEYLILNKLKLSEFENKDWQECIYEVPRKVETTGKIEHIKARKVIDCSDRPEAHIEKHRIFAEIWDKINALVDAVNELKEAKNDL